MCPSDGSSIRSTVRPSDSPPVLQRCKISIVLIATILTMLTASTKVAAFGRATSFVASFVEAVNIVNIVAINTVLILHLSKTGGLSVGRTVDRIDGPSDGHTSERLF